MRADEVEQLRKQREREKAKLESISFGRFSSKPQEEGDSIRRQEEAYKRVCERYKDRCFPSERYEFGHFFGRGESGFSGEHLADGGSLAALITALESGEINPHKTCIVIEAYDRLGRLEPDLATGMLSRIVRLGCALAVDRPDCWIGSPADMNGPQWILISTMIYLAHEESKQKSVRCKGSWKSKRTKAIADKVPLTGQVPFWCKMVHGRIEEIKDRGDIVRKIFELAADGLGKWTITAKFNKDGVPCFGRKGTWQQRYVWQILHDRRVLGECQLYAEDEKRERVKQGEPVHGYYPEVVSLELWHRAHALLDPRKKKAGRRGEFVNIFSGLLKDADYNTTFYARHKLIKGKNYHYLICDAALQGRMDTMMTVPLAEFETGFLSALAELDPSTLYGRPAADDLADRIGAVEGELGELQDGINGMKARLLKRYSEALADTLEQAEERYKVLSGQLRTLQEERGAKPVDTLGETKTLISLWSESKEDPIFREKLRSRLAALIEKVWVRITTDGGHHRRCYCQIEFRSGGARIIQIDIIAKGKGGNKRIVTVQTIGDSHEKGVYLPNPACDKEE